MTFLKLGCFYPNYEGGEMDFSSQSRIQGSARSLGVNKALNICTQKNDPVAIQHAAAIAYSGIPKTIAYKAIRLCADLGATGPLWTVANKMDKANPSKKTVTSVIATCRESNPRAGKTLGAFFKSIEDFSTIIDWILDFDDPWVADSIEFSHYKLLSSRQAKRLFRIQLRSYGGNKIPVHFRKEILKRLNVREAMQLYIQEGVTFDFGEAIKLFGQNECIGAFLEESSTWGLSKIFRNTSHIQENELTKESLCLCAKKKNRGGIRSITDALHSDVNAVELLVKLYTNDRIGEKEVVFALGCLDKETSVVPRTCKENIEAVLEKIE